ncbi:hypothetical protein QBC38DRAFT_360550 [Podospora fimiseda]|uniref:RING-type domain-containing protein n=1 Tax=Podospora fimiseda TaxID=252190 RepID=A0AAN7BTA9_9PEZI|nr:hypothetical protein QBC38DRAFT_360550 [Podospora fimiseda]
MSQPTTSSEKKHHKSHQQQQKPPTSASSLPTGEHRRRSTTATTTDKTKKEEPSSYPRPPKRIIKLHLKPLDPNSLSCILNVTSKFLTSSRSSSTITAKLARHIRQSYKEKGIRLPQSDKSRVLLYDSGAKKLGTNPPNLDSGTVTIWYRVQLDQDKDKWKFSFLGADKLFGKGFKEELRKAIDEGGTVGRLRKMVGEYLGLVGGEENRVRLYMQDGMKRDGLYGDDWILKEFGRAWLCRWIGLEVRDYVVFQKRGMGGGYVLHRGDSRKGCMKSLRRWVERGGLGGKGRVKLRHGGKEVEDEERVKWGETYDFEFLDVDDAEKFNEEEGWLLGQSGEECLICGDEKKVNEFPVRMTERCEHEEVVCKRCLEKWLQSSVEGGNWGKLRCPIPACKEVMGYAYVRRYASAETFERVDRWLLNEALGEIVGFERCLGGACGYGHVHDPACEVFKCRNAKCGKRHCVKHRIAHEDETCREYEKRQERRQEENKKSERTVGKMAKECPNCKRMVHKTEGCNHMTCTCRHEWCYVCFAPYMTAASIGILLCHHNPGCTESPQPFAHLFDRHGRLLNPRAQELRNVRVPHPLPPHLPFPGGQHHGPQRHDNPLVTPPPPAVPVANVVRHPNDLPRQFRPPPLITRAAIGLGPGMRRAHRQQRQQQQQQGSQVGVPGGMA